MAHGTSQAILGLGDGSNIGAPNAADANNTLDALAATQTEIDAHTADTADAHDASAVSVLDTATDWVGTDVEAVLAEVADNGRTYFSTLTADSADIQNDTLTASGLTVTVVPGTYEVEALVAVTTAAAADIKFKFDGTATVTATVGVSDLFLINGPGGADATVAFVPVLLPTSWTTAVTYATTGALADSPFFFKGKLVVTVAGTILVQFAQGTTNASNTHVDKGSYLKLTKVA